MNLMNPLLALLAATGEATSQVMQLEKLWDRFLTWGIDAGERLVGALIILVVGRIIIVFLKKLVANILAKRKVDAGVQSFARSLTSILLNLLLVVAIISKLGVETTSFAALLASAGVAIGMALSGNLSNFAGGLIVLVFRPYKVGDVIESQGETGTVREIQIFHTILTTYDNKVIYIPNGALSSGTVVNYSREATRRLSWTVGVEYGTDFERVRQAALDIVKSDPRVLTTPAPAVILDTLADSSVNVTLRAWVKTEDYWAVDADVRQRIYAEFNRLGIGFPFPQVTVHQAKD